MYRQAHSKNLARRPIPQRDLTLAAAHERDRLISTNTIDRTIPTASVIQMSLVSTGSSGSYSSFIFCSSSPMRGSLTELPLNERWQHTPEK